jgi:hypothetical protein
MRYLLFILLILPFHIKGQVIQANPNGVSIIGDRVMSGPSVILEAKSTTRGFLPPRMTTTQRNAMTPLEGLTIYNTTNKTMEHYNGTYWVNESLDTMCMVVACSDETSDLTVADAKVTFRAPFKMKVVAVRANVNAKPVGSDIEIDIRAGGTTIFDTKPRIDNDAFTSVGSTTSVVLDATDSLIDDDEEIKIDVKIIGSSTAGKGLKVHIYYIKQY